MDTALTVIQVITFLVDIAMSAHQDANPVQVTTHARPANPVTIKETTNAKDKQQAS